jgi:serine/threonine protein kinase
MHFHDHNRKPIPFPTDAEDHDSVVEDADRHLWTRAANLGSGAFGSVQLWIKYDRDTGNVLDRVAVKSVTCTEKFWLHDAALWFDGVASRRVPAEAAAMRVLNNELHNLSNEELNDTTNEGVRVELNNELEDDPSEELKENSLCPLIIGYRGCRVYADEKRTFRIAMPASEFGSFYSWIEDKVKSLPRGGQLPDLPPAFIFDFFAACLTAVRFMVKRNMVHNDIKLDNLLIFADDPILESPLSEFEHDEGSGLGWGFHPVFTDFGLTTPIHCRAIPNPQGLVGMGTTSYQPPEQVVDRGRPSLPGKPRHSIVHGQENEPVNEKAMVFSIAVMVFRVCSSCTADACTCRRG